MNERLLSILLLFAVIAVVSLAPGRADAYCSPPYYTVMADSDDLFAVAAVVPDIDGTCGCEFDYSLPTKRNYQMSSSDRAEVLLSGYGISHHGGYDGLPLKRFALKVELVAIDAVAGDLRWRTTSEISSHITPFDLGWSVTALILITPTNPLAPYGMKRFSTTCAGNQHIEYTAGGVVDADSCSTAAEYSDLQLLGLGSAGVALSGFDVNVHTAESGSINPTVLSIETALTPGTSGPRVETLCTLAGTDSNGGTQSIDCRIDGVVFGASNSNILDVRSESFSSCADSTGLHVRATSDRSPVGYAWGIRRFLYSNTSALPFPGNPRVTGMFTFAPFFNTTSSGATFGFDWWNKPFWDKPEMCLENQVTEFIGWR